MHSLCCSFSLSLLVLAFLLRCRTVAAGSAPPPLPRTASTPAAETTPVSPPACTASSTSLINGGFFDLRPDMALIPTDGSDGSASHRARRAVTSDYRARGYDYGANFTLNLCGPVVEPVSRVVGLDEALWANVSAYYTTSKGKVVSIGQASMDLKSRGRMLVLKYTDGSPCDDSTDTRPILRGRGLASHHIHDDLMYKHDETDYGVPGVAAHSSSSLRKPAAAEEPSALPTLRRKSTVLSFHCDRDPTLAQASVSFVGTPDECAYFFEVRTQNSCPRSTPIPVASVGPGSVFALILGITILVYILGGVFYNRTVAHARGWRQLPNYSLWAAIWNSITNAFMSVFSICSSFIPRKRGYHCIPHSPDGPSRTREDENRLIDQLDEEWDD